MAPVARTWSGRNKLLHRFYEPLVLLFALDRVQGDHVYHDSNRLPLKDMTTKELRRRFLNSLSYICDYQKGGDTITAIGAAAGPGYYVAGNKTPQEKVRTFLKLVFSRLEQMYNVESRERLKMERELLELCASFSEQRIQTYWRFLQVSMAECRDGPQDESTGAEIRKLTQQLENASTRLVDLCLYCYNLMRSTDMEFIRQRVERSADYGNTRCPFTAAKHYIGRLAFHVKNVKVLVAAAERLPGLVSSEPEVFLVESPQAIVLPPSSRSGLRLANIARRMVHPDQNALLSEIQSSLENLNHQFHVEQTVQEKYLKKNFQARVHAELIILEHFYERRGTLQHLDNDPFIACSKPACYCCSLYFLEHPANVEPPATHQKIYLNWLPPTSVSGVEDPNSAVAAHEKVMLNKMVQRIRSRTIEQIRSQTGRRQRHFDSTTGETASTRAVAAYKNRRQPEELLLAEGWDGTIAFPRYVLMMPDTQDDNQAKSGDSEIVLRAAMKNLKVSLSVAQSDEDSDHEGGVRLL